MRRCGGAGDRRHTGRRRAWRPGDGCRPRIAAAGDARRAGARPARRAPEASAALEAGEPRAPAAAASRAALGVDGDPEPVLQAAWDQRLAARIRSHRRHRRDGAATAASRPSRGRSTASWRTRTRSWRSSWLDGSSTGVEPGGGDDRRKLGAAPAEQRAEQRDLGAPGSGAAARIAASPRTPAPRASRMSSVSAWSSAWCPVATAPRPCAVRPMRRARDSARRAPAPGAALVGGFGPVDGQDVVRHAKRCAQSRATASASAAAAVAQGDDRRVAAATSPGRAAAARSSRARLSGPPDTASPIARPARPARRGRRRSGRDRDRSAKRCEPSFVAAQGIIGSSARTSPSALAAGRDPCAAARAAMAP